MKLFHGHMHPKGFWIRLGAWKDSRVGKGISVSCAPPLFSTRNGYQKHIKIGNVRIAYLPAIVYK